MITIVYVNPVNDGLNAKVLESVKNHLNEINKEYTLLDLYADGFNPVFTKEERDSYYTGTGISTDPIAKKYQDTIKKATHMVFIFPIWWMSYPAILKGFFDRTLLPNYAFSFTETGIQSLLNNVTKFTVSTIAGGVPKESLTDTIEKHFFKHMLNTISRNADINWLHLIEHTATQPEILENHIKQIKERC